MGPRCQETSARLRPQACEVYGAATQLQPTAYSALYNWWAGGGAGQAGMHEDLCSPPLSAFVTPSDPLMGGAGGAQHGLGREQYHEGRVLNGTRSALVPPSDRAEQGKYFAVGAGGANIFLACQIAFRRCAGGWR